MNNKVNEQVKELLDNNVINNDVARSIIEYYEKKKENPASKLFVVFGIIGAILASLGIILVFAHNWDEMSIFSKCIVSFLPILIGQFFCGYSLFYKNDSVTCKESSSVFLFFSVGATISLIAQTYNISGDFGKFILTWMLLCLPLVYLMKSQIVSLLYIIGITIYCVNTNYFGYPRHQNLWYWILLLTIIPNYFQLLKTDLKSNFTSIHNWFLPISIAISLASIKTDNKGEEILFFSYLFLFTCYYFIGKLPVFKSNKLLTNGFSIVGKIGTFYMLYLASFRWMWKDLITKSQIDWFKFSGIITILLFGFALMLLLYNFKKQISKPNEFFLYSFLLLFILYFISFASVVPSVIIANIFIVLCGISEISKGNDENSIARMNFGILIISILIVCRFFDTNMSFIVRGILFIIVGFGFFGLNYYMLKKKK